MANEGSQRNMLLIPFTHVRFFRDQIRKRFEVPKA